VPTKLPASRVVRRRSDRLWQSAAISGGGEGAGGYGWYAGGQAAPLVREKIVAMLAANTTAALG
jgi:hypothetical protein